MMKTIRAKMALVFVVFMISLVLLGILLNALFLEEYYIYKNKNNFLEISSRINNEYSMNKEGIQEFLRAVDKLEGVSCMIIDKDLAVKMISSSPKQDSIDAKLPNEIEQLLLANKDKLEKTYLYSVTEKSKAKTIKLAFLMKLGSSDYLLLRKPLKGIQESATTANQFYLFAGLLVVVIGGVFIYFFSGRLTRPIKDMSKIAEQISSLDFVKYDGYHSEDELGRLGKSINKMSDKLDASINELIQDVERRKQLVRNMSHELKTPIGVIKGYAEGLKFGVVENEEKRKKYCETIADECNRMDGMVKELLNLSTLESGVFQLDVSKFDLSEMVDEQAERFEPVFEREGVKLKLHLEKNLIVSADKDLIGRAVNNYITNAIHHAEGEKCITITTEQSNNGAVVSVFNTGKHIPIEDINHVWDVFYKVDKARSRQYNGHGLGLAIARLIVELHGGSTEVFNVGDGVSFYIELPK